MVAARRRGLAFCLGGMGTATTNFYHGAYTRQGWSEVAAAVRERWQAGDRDGAAALVTDEMVLATTLLGTEDMVRARLGCGPTPASTPSGSTPPETRSTSASPRSGGRSSS